MTTRLDEIRARLRAAIDEAERANLNFKPWLTVPASDLAYLLDRVERLERLRVAADEHTNCAEHYHGCATNYSRPGPCSCGLDDVIDALDAAQPDATPDEKGEP